MRETDIIEQIITELESTMASDVQVRTEGGDQDVNPPEVIVEWNARRLSGRNGHNNIGGFTTDANGNRDGIEFHQYFRMTVDTKLRYYDEVTRDVVLDELHDYFQPIVYDADQFDSDTMLWEVGTTNPSPNSLLEPDWYEVGLLIQFTFVKRATQSFDTLETINKDITLDESIDETST